MRDSAVQHGRDPDRIEITTFAPAELESDPVGSVAELAALGVDRILMLPGELDDRPAADAIEALADRVVKPNLSSWRRGDKRPNVGGTLVQPHWAEERYWRHSSVVRPRVNRLWASATSWSA